MKKQMLTLVIGILIGAIIATGIFLVLESNDSSSSSSDSSSMEMPSGERGNFDENMVGGGERPDGDMEEMNENATSDAE